MRVARLAAAAVGVFGLVAAGSVATVPQRTGSSAPVQDTIIVQPGVIRVGRVQAGPLSTAACEKAYRVACYGPAQIRRAYDLPALYSEGVTGRGATIVIVDSYGSPTIQADLHTFDQTFGYPDPPSFKIITPAGAPPAWNPANSTMAGWGVETSLDVEYAHTVAPGANILLVETPAAETEGVTGFPQIVEAENYVIGHHLGDVISQSFGATEETFTNYGQLAPLRSAYLNAYQHGITVLASSGDTGATNYELDGSTFYTSPVVGWPASDPLVTGVGGTQIRENPRGLNGYSQVAWNDTYDTNLLESFTGGSTPTPFASTGGVSEFFKLPSYQDGVAGTIASATGASGHAPLTRGVPDISMSGACDGSVDLYTSFPGVPSGWSLVCGTSEASPELAGVVALADQVAGHPLGLINPRLYQLSAEHAPGIVDITSGNNTVTFTQGTPSVTTTVQGYSAGLGYDLTSGVGTVNAAYFVPELAGSHR